MSEKYPFTLIKQEIAKRQGKALDFAVGQQPFPLSSRMSDWIRENWDMAMVPGNPTDIAGFSTAAVSYLKRQYDLEIPAECILPTAGGRAAMGIFSACTLTPADSVMVTEPGYPAFARLAAQRGAAVIVSDLDQDNDFAPDFEFSEDRPRGSLTMLSVNYPNNPSGATLSPRVRARLKDLAGAGTILFNDATYGPLVYDDAPRSLLSEVFPDDSRPDVVELHSFSKLYPIGPLAVSFLAGPADLLQAMATYSEYAWSPLSRLQLAATAECLQDAERIQMFRELIPTRLESLQSVLDELGFKTFTAHSGTYMICEVPGSIAGVAVSSAQHAAKLLMDTFDIAVVPLDTRHRAYLRFAALHRPGDLDKLAKLGPNLRLSQ